jgi:hypothetical protein
LAEEAGAHGLETTNRDIDTYQAGFTPGKSTVHNIHILRMMIEKAKRIKHNIYCIFIGFQKAFDNINHELLLGVLTSYGYGPVMMSLLRDLHFGARGKVLTSQGLSNEFPIEKGTLQGSSVFSFVFITFLQRLLEPIMDDARFTGVAYTTEDGKKTRINNLVFGDDLCMVSTSRKYVTAAFYQSTSTKPRFGQ